MRPVGQGEAGPVADAPAGARERVAGVVGLAVRQAVADAGAAGVALLDDGSPEAALAAEWCAAALGNGAVWRVGPPPPAEAARLAERLVADVAGLSEGAPRPAPDGVAAELHRCRARLVAAARHALLAHPANKTALLLARALPPEPLLPLGDLYASQVQALAGAWTGPPEVVELAGAAGGVARLDRALAAFVDARAAAEEAFAGLPAALRDAVLRRIREGRFGRRQIGLIPKLGARTLGIDFLA